jgi:hypothetical protein
MRRRSHPLVLPPAGPFALDASAPQAQGLIGWWTAAAARGSRVLPDRVGSGNDATIDNDFIGGDDPELGYCWANNGSTNRAITARRIDLSGRDFSVCAWSRRGATGADHFLVSNGNLHFGYRSSDQFTFAFSFDDLNTPATFTDAGAHLWVGTFNSTTRDRRLYRDGALVASDTSAGQVSANDLLNLGSHNAGSYFTGRFLEARLYDRVLAAEEIRALWEPSSRWALYLPVVRPLAGSSATYLARLRGRGIVYAAATAQQRGNYNAGYAAYGSVLRGRGALLGARLATARGRGAALGAAIATTRGRATISAGSFIAALRGAGIVRRAMLATARGSATMSVTYAGRLGGRYRAANDALDRYELHIGTDAAPDLDAAASETFASLPHATAALAAGHAYHLVLRRRNAWGLVSQNTRAWVVTIDASGNELPTPPSDPTQISLTPAAGGTITVSARYAYDADGVANQADRFVVYLTADGTDPDPATDVPAAIVVMRKADGVARLDYTAGPYADGTEVRAIVRTRRSGTPNADSTGTTVYWAIATTAGPLAVAPRSLFYGRGAAQAQSAGGGPGGSFCLVQSVTIIGSSPTTIDVMWRFNRALALDVDNAPPELTVDGVGPNGPGQLDIEPGGALFQYDLPLGIYTWRISETPFYLTAPGFVIPAPQQGTTE